MNYFSKKTFRRTLALGLASVAVIMVSLSGCKKASPLGVGSCDNAATKAKEFTDAYQAFVADMTIANCEKLKKVGEDYLNAARKCSVMNVKEEAERALAEWGNFNCSEVVENAN